MSCILSKDTSAELLLRKAMWAANARGYRLHANIVGRPDIVFVAKRLAIFVDGCFWHGCACKRRPKRNALYWIPKIQGNRRRDK
jgi:DNA mismatch endonuclease (patch repair protein)